MIGAINDWPVALPGGPLPGFSGETETIEKSPDNVTPLDPAALSDPALVRAIRAASGARRERLFAELYRRYARKVAGWCLRICADPDEAADLTQEVFLRVHRYLDGFREDSRFSTWLYTIARRTAVSGAVARQRRQPVELDAEFAPEPADPRRTAAGFIDREQVLDKLATCMARDLKPEEAEVVYLHYVDGLTLPAITQLLDLTNRSGAKALLVGGMRKLRRHFKSWHERQETAT